MQIIKLKAIVKYTAVSQYWVSDTSLTFIYYQSLKLLKLSCLIYSFSEKKSIYYRSLLSLIKLFTLLFLFSLASRWQHMAVEGTHGIITQA